MNMVLGVATLGWSGWRSCVMSWLNTATCKPLPLHIVTGKHILASYQDCYKATTEPILAYVHDDVTIFEPGWDDRVLAQFDLPNVGIVGFGGALGHGRTDLYTAPYHLPNLARQQFLSNMRGGEQHGGIFKGECDVAILDGFALFVRREILDKVGGWNQQATYFMYSEWLCCEARRQGYRIRLVGVDCEHLGGRSSFSGLTDDYEEAHRYFYENNRDVLPFRVGE